MKKAYSRINFAALNNCRRSGILAIAALFLTAVVLFASNSTAQAAGNLQLNYYQPVNPFNVEPDVWERSQRSAVSGLIDGLPDEFNAVRLNRDALQTVLQYAPHEAYLPLGASETILPLPMPDGSFMNFRI